MKLRFEPDGMPANSQMAAGREVWTADARPESGKNTPAESRLAEPVPREESSLDESVCGPAKTAENHLLDTPDVDAWRGEVAARVNRYRARRRPRGPRYPSLALKFEPSEPERFATASVDLRIAPASPLPESAPEEASRPQEIPILTYSPAPVISEPAKIIEFPRPWIPPARPVDELAEPVLERPRILEAPEILPPPPALGGILIEAAEDPPNEKRPGFEIPLQSAPMRQRLLAVAVDGGIVLTALAGFAAIFFKLTGTIPAPREAAGIGLGLAGTLWAAYQYLLIAHAGTTPGLKLAKLELCRFDGSRVPRRLRCWRTLASVLSGMSLGMGYAWCWLDEDGLCWHDRITRTYMAPKTPSRTDREHP
jgi:uncharacterized RDD family membrane protein YckC